MHEIPNFPFPSLYQPENTPAAQSASPRPTESKRSEKPETRHADRKDQAR